MDFNSSSPFPEGVISFLDTDLYKLTMQCAVFKFFKDVPVTYAFTNRTPEKKLSRTAFKWLQEQIQKLGNISLSDEEYRFLKTHCTYLTDEYINFLKEFRLHPREQAVATFTTIGEDTGADSDIGDLHVEIKGTWLETILYEIPLLALTSEAYFRFMDTDWSYEGQEEQAFGKGMRLLEAGCTFSEFGTRRRRDYHTQALVFRGLVKASKEAEKKGLPGKLTGTSNVHLAMRFNIPPVGTVAHEWFMGIAAIHNDYKAATELALRYWVGCFGGKLGIALTDTFGTQDFLRAFSQPVHPIDGDESKFRKADGTLQTYAELFQGVRQDSGDPADYVKMLREYYDGQGIKEKKTMVFSDSLNIERCLEYKAISEAAGFVPTFGVGTFLTNDFTHLKTGTKSVPLNIVIKLSSANGRPAIKISDNAGKNTGDKETVQKVKSELGYVEKEWKGGDETQRWGKEGDSKA
ncbi:Nicotinate phosphoribosyltransferase [Colletotrichum truncatum]|uniref:Nicotinate phosphoribosyltransferase n=1 Tax=Colletotrichum truncatum TaxID=5467 RepID=A0ACC3YV14_COLTU|nr:Nicotinate phosphoribosyltransferase [Colletotrichum truncatum]KAF6782169.1 Nicotinate phosphoribosyltransferase [Colletotrichum truncatum]